MKKLKKREAKKTMGNQLVIEAAIKQRAFERLPDSGRYKMRFKVRSASSNKLYLVSWDDAPGAKYWVCSCLGCISHGDCKHLKSIGLWGRERSKSLPANKRKMFQ